MQSISLKPPLVKRSPWWLGVALPFCSQNFGKVEGPMNSILSFSECRLSGRDTQVVGTLEPYLLQLNSFEPFAFRGRSNSKTLFSHPHDACIPTSHPVKLSLPSISFYIDQYRKKANSDNDHSIFEFPCKSKYPPTQNIDINQSVNVLFTKCVKEIRREDTDCIMIQIWPH